MDWNLRYDENDTPWDKGAPSPALLGLMEAQPRFFKPRSNTTAKVIIPGCGYGHDAPPFLNRGFDVTGLDISDLALQGAQQRYGKSQHLHWLHADLFDLPETLLGNYDIVWEHTCYCAIPTEMRAQYVAAMLSLLKPNAYFIGIFYTDTGNKNNDGPPFQTSRQEVFELFDQHFQLEWEGRPNQCFAGRENREWMMIWRKPITPSQKCKM